MLSKSEYRKFTTSGMLKCLIRSKIHKVVNCHNRPPPLFKPLHLSPAPSFLHPPTPRPAGLQNPPYLSPFPSFLHPPDSTSMSLYVYIYTHLLISVVHPPYNTALQLSACMTMSTLFSSVVAVSSQQPAATAKTKSRSSV